MRESIDVASFEVWEKDRQPVICDSNNRIFEMVIEMSSPQSTSMLHVQRPGREETGGLRTFETVADQLSIFHASFLFSRLASSEG